ncbi:MAG: SprB repeat-containing protein [Bacteroidetes bacterium]|nr:SprB repeat-containing protein [Bacteroidota bacterium]
MPQTSPFATVAGIYTIVATDVNGCTTSSIQTINEPTPVVLTASATNALCNAANGSLTFSATGGTGLFTFTVNGNTQTSPLLLLQELIPLLPQISMVVLLHLYKPLMNLHPLCSQRVQQMPYAMPQMGV